LGVLGEHEKKALALLAEKHKKLANASPAIAHPAIAAAETAKAKALFDELSVPAGSTPDAALSDAKERYYKNPHNAPRSFEQYWKTRKEEKRTYENTIYLSNRLFHEDCITHMEQFPNCYHHIITDIPYGIDTDNMDQNSGTLMDVDRVKESHIVEENM